MVAEMKSVQNGYKKTQFGYIPEDWNLLQLDQIATRITRKNKGNVSKNVLTISSKYGLVSQTEFFKKNVASKNLDGYYLLEKNDFAYNKSYSNGYPMGAIKPLNLYDKGVVSSLYICFRFDENLININFMTHYFETKLWHEEVAQIAQEGARNHGLLNVSIKDFFKIKLICPPLQEQQKIADILSTLDKQIENVNHLIFKTKELKKGIMQQLFTRGIQHSKYKDVELGEIPFDWEVNSIKDISNFCANGFVGTATPFYTSSENGTLYLQSNNIRENKFDLSKTIYINSDFTNKYKRAKVQTGDLLTVQSGHIGTSSVVTPLYNNVYCHALIITRPKVDKVDSNYLAYYLNSSVGKKRLSNIFVGSTIKHINVKDFIKFLVPVPPVKEQKKIVEILSCVDKQIENYEQESQKYIELKKGLMQQLLTGKLRVTV